MKLTAQSVSAHSTLSAGIVSSAFLRRIYTTINHAVVQLGEQIGACAVSDPSADVDMVTHFYIVAASGLIESWLTGELDKSPEEIVSFLDVIIHDHVRGAAFRLGTSDRLI